jgi:hypothetical protein
MAQNGKAYVNETNPKDRKKNSEAEAATNFLTEEEQIDQFANLIIDIYLQTEHKYENGKHSNSS